MGVPLGTIVLVAPPGVADTVFISSRFVLRFCLPPFFSTVEEDPLCWSLGLNSVTLTKSIRYTTRDEAHSSQTQVKTLPVHNVLGPSWALNEPSEDRECAEAGEADSTERLGQALESRIETSLVLTRFIMR